jgi:hypothetical protein
MRLGIDDETKENPTPEDIERMVPDAPPNEDFIAFLERSDDVWIEGEATPDGRFHVSRFEGPEILNGTRDVDGRELRELFKLYLAGDDRFRQRMTWKAWDPKAAPASTGGGKQVYWPVIVLPGVALGAPAAARLDEDDARAVGAGLLRRVRPAVPCCGGGEAGGSPAHGAVAENDGTDHEIRAGFRVDAYQRREHSTQ